MELSNDEIRRYSRHLILPEVGMAGQKKFKSTSVLCIGAGGLGVPIVAGLQLADVQLILSGALPATMLALAIDSLLGWIERLVQPRGLEASQ